MVAKTNVVGADVNELAPMLDQSGVSTAAACKVLDKRGALEIAGPRAFYCAGRGVFSPPAGSPLPQYIAP